LKESIVTVTSRDGHNLASFRIESDGETINMDFLKQGMCILRIQMKGITVSRGVLMLKQSASKLEKKNGVFRDALNIYPVPEILKGIINH
jgi:hypothetical protein